MHKNKIGLIKTKDKNRTAWIVTTRLKYEYLNRLYTSSLVDSIFENCM